MCKEIERSSIAQIPAANVTNVATFDAFIQSQLDSSPSGIAAFQSSYDCPGHTGHNTRFSLTTYCYFTVFQSSKSCSVAVIPLQQLCRSTCQVYLDSFVAEFAEPKTCNQNPSSDARTSRTAITSAFGDFCARLPNAGCSKGIATDVNQCGFAFKEDIAPYCEKNRSDPCCPATLATPAAQTSSNSASGPNMMLIAGIAGGALVLLVLGVLWYRRRASSMSRKPSKAGSYASDRTPHALYEPPKGKASQLYSPQTTSPKASPSLNYRPAENYSPNPFANTSTPNLQSPVQQPYERPGQKKCTVLEDFVPSMEDEMGLQEGDVVLVQEVFDDGYFA
jgi:hypothetical protein